MSRKNTLRRYYNAQMTRESNSTKGMIEAFKKVEVRTYHVGKEQRTLLICTSRINLIIPHSPKKL